MLPAKSLDWFERHPRDSRTRCESVASVDELRAVLRAQMDRNLKGVVGENAPFVLHDVQFLVDDTHFPAVAERFASDPLHSVLSWHATQNVGAVRSIAKHGYVVPNDIVPTQGFTLKMHNGSYYGEGVYSSGRFEVSRWFSFIDRAGGIQLLLNQVDLGVVHFVHDDPSETIVTERRGYNSATQKMWHKVSVANNPEFDRGIFATVDGVFGNGADTRLTHDMRVIVSGSATRITPLAIVTLVPRLEFAALQRYFVVPTHRGRSGKPLIRVERRFEFDDEDRRYVVKLFRVCGDWHVVCPSPLSLDLLSCVEMRHHVVVPLRLLRGDATVSQQVATLFGALSGGAKRLVLHDSRAVQAFAGATSADQFVSHAAACGASAGGEQTRAALAGVLDVVTREQRNDLCELVYLVVDDPALSEDVAALDALADEFSTLLAVRRLVVKVICVGREYGSDARLIRLKFCLQTAHETVEELLHKVAEPLAWSGVVDTLLEENAAFAKNYLAGVTFDVPAPFGVIGEGFVVDLVHNPIWLGQGLPPHSLYKGSEPLPALIVNGHISPVEYVTRESLTALLTKRAPAVESEPQRSARERDVAAAAEAYAAMVSHFSDALMRVLCRLRSFVIRSQGRMRQYAPVVKDLCEVVTRELQTVERDALLSTRCDVGQLRRTAHAVQKLLSDINAFADVPLAGAWFQQLLQLKFAKAIAKRAVIAASSEVDWSRELAAASDLVGWRVVVRAGNAAQIEPWMLMVPEVTTLRASAADSFASAGAFAILGDSDQCDERQRAYLAWVFTGNPHLVQPTQPIALLVLSWVRALEAVFRGETPATAEAWSQIWSLSERVRSVLARDVLLRESTLPGIGKASDAALSAQLTEAAGVTSLGRLLGALLLPEARQFVSFDCADARFSRLAFAMLSEAVRRCTRSYLAFKSTNANDELRRVLGVVVGGKNDWAAFDVSRATAKTGDFFRRSFSNCSPFALVAALAFLERWHAGADRAAVAADFASRDRVSMRVFLATHLRGFDGRITQLALFTQALRYARSAQRGAFLFADPLAIVKAAFEEQAMLAAAEQRVRDASHNRLAQREARRMQAAAPFLMWHAEVRLFSFADVDALNLTIADRSQWAERLDSGLLKHHCCAPQCPDFLRNFATPSDLRRNRRNGLMSHLRHCQVIGWYVPSLHIQARACARNATFAHFLALLERKFAKNDAFNKLDEVKRREFLHSVWAFHNKSTQNT